MGSRIQYILGADQGSRPMGTTAHSHRGPVDAICRLDDLPAVTMIRPYLSSRSRGRHDLLLLLVSDYRHFCIGLSPLLGRYLHTHWHRSTFRGAIICSYSSSRCTTVDAALV